MYRIRISMVKLTDNTRYRAQAVHMARSFPVCRGSSCSSRLSPVHNQPTRKAKHPRPWSQPMSRMHRLEKRQQRWTAACQSCRPESLRSFGSVVEFLIPDNCRSPKPPQLTHKASYVGIHATRAHDQLSPPFAAPGQRRVTNSARRPILSCQ